MYACMLACVHVYCMHMRASVHACTHLEHSEIVQVIVVLDPQRPEYFVENVVHLFSLLHCCTTKGAATMHKVLATMAVHLHLVLGARVDSDMPHLHACARSWRSDADVCTCMCACALAVPSVHALHVMRVVCACSMHARVHAHMHARVLVCMHVCIHACIHAREREVWSVHANEQASMRACVRACVNVCVHVGTCMRLCARASYSCSNVCACVRACANAY